MNCTLIGLATPAICGATYVLVRVHISRAQTRQARLRESARSEGVQLSARTLRHQLANKLAPAVGYSEILADDPRLPHDLEQQAQQIRASAIAAVEALDKFQHEILRVELDETVSGPSLLDVDASTTDQTGTASVAGGSSSGHRTPAPHARPGRSR
jgi:hypothetical protein